LIVAIGSALFGWRAFRLGAAPATSINAAMYGGMALKWFWFGAALYVAFARLKLAPAPLLIGMAGAQLGYWVAMLRRQGNGS
jgi:F0F1-type ATP synthase assembly protein I